MSQMILNATELDYTKIPNKQYIPNPRQQLICKHLNNSDYRLEYAQTI